MLKLPKGLKKKKKGKKSKKDQELFNEEELEQYRREHQHRQDDHEQSNAGGVVTGAAGVGGGVADNPDNGASGGGGDDEWSKFNALTAGVDSILKKTQGELDRIKSTSFYQRVPPKKPEQSAQAKKEQLHKQQQQQQQQQHEQQTKDNKKSEATAATTSNPLEAAVVELSDSESESDEADDIFDTTYIDVIASGEVPLAFVPESPTDDTVDDGPDPFDTTYAEKVIKGPEVSKRGKKLVCIGSAVEVLTGRVESFTGTSKRRPRRGPKNLLLESFDETEDGGVGADTAVASTDLLNEPIKTLLDVLENDIPSAPIDLSVSLHLDVLKEQHEKRQQQEEANVFELNQAFDERSRGVCASNVIESVDWTEFELERASGTVEPVEEDNLDLSDVVDPFDTAFVETIIPKHLEDDFDFDPRAVDAGADADVDDDDFDPRGHEKDELVHREAISLSERKSSLSLNIEKAVSFAYTPIDLLGVNGDANKAKKPLTPYYANSDTANIVNVPPPQPAATPDPFDTSFVVRSEPTDIELNLIAKDLLVEATLKHSLSDPDFDPRATTPGVKITIETPAEQDLLATDAHHLDIKVLTPAVESCEYFHVQEADPFDTSIARNIAPGQAELKFIESELLANKEEFKVQAPTVDILTCHESEAITTKVLTPQPQQSENVGDDFPADPFDTSFAESLKPGQTELRILEDEFIERRQQ